MGGVPSKPTDPTVTPKVIAAGYHRTGTMSMAKALEKLLNGPVLHCGNALYGREDGYAKQWYMVLKVRNDREKLLKLLKEVTMGYVGITDGPAVLFVPELMELYPDAKVVLVDRDTEKWWQSMQPLMNKGSMPNWLMTIMLWPCYTWRWIPYWVPQLMAYTKEKYGEDPGKELKDKHNAMVRAAVPRKSLLEMQVTDGWTPLCSFLKIPVPSEPFPHENDAESFDEALSTIITMALSTWAMYIVGYGSGLVVILYWAYATGRLQLLF